VRSATSQRVLDRCVIEKGRRGKALVNHQNAAAAAEGVLQQQHIPMLLVISLACRVRQQPRGL